MLQFADRLADAVRRTSPLCWKSMPSTMPTGRAVRKLPDTSRTVALAIGVFGSPCEKAASISKRSWPAASCAASRATASEIRSPWLKRETWPFAASCSFATPIGYQTNLLVMGPGHYRFKDFIVAGTPLVLIVWLAFSLFAPWYYGL